MPAAAALTYTLTVQMSSVGLYMTNISIVLASTSTDAADVYVSAELVNRIDVM